MILKLGLVSLGYIQVYKFPFNMHFCI